MSNVTKSELELLQDPLRDPVATDSDKYKVVLENDRVRRCVQLWLGGSDVQGIARQRGLSAGQVRGLLQRGRSEIIRRTAAAFA